MTPDSNPTVWPELRCRDAKTMIKFLTEAFGFEEALVVEDAGIVHHAELRWSGCGGVMVGDERAHAGDVLHEQLPSGPASISVVCDDPDALFTRATARGAKVLQSVKDKDYGSRDFLVRDLEGNVWTFGTRSS